MRTVIGIGHKARQGRDTAATYLHEKHGITVISFNDALYEECRNLRMNTYVPGFSRSNVVTKFVVYSKKHRYDFDKRTVPKEIWSLFDICPYYEGMTDKNPALLQWWGTDVKRKRDPDYWVKQVRDVIVANPDTDYVIPDCRFRNEAQMIKDMGGYVWDIRRMVETKTNWFEQYIASDRDPNHPSETDLDDWHFDTIKMALDGDIESLQKMVETEYNSIKEK